MRRNINTAPNKNRSATPAAKTKSAKEIDEFWEMQIKLQLLKQRREKMEQEYQTLMDSITCPKCGQSNDAHDEQVCKETIEQEEKLARGEIPATSEPSLDMDDFMDVMRGSGILGDMEQQSGEGAVYESGKEGDEGALCLKCGQQKRIHFDSICEDMYIRNYIAKRNAVDPIKIEEVANPFSSSSSRSTGGRSNKKSGQRRFKK